MRLPNAAMEPTGQPEYKIMEFLGHTIKYWLELEKKARQLNAVKLLEEIAELRGKVSFYESRLDEMDKFRKLK